MPVKETGPHRTKSHFFHSSHSRPNKRFPANSRLLTFFDEVHCGWGLIVLALPCNVASFPGKTRYERQQYVLPDVFLATPENKHRILQCRRCRRCRVGER